MIIKKLYYYRESPLSKHLEDIRGILAETKIDHEYVKKWIDEFGLQNEWNKVKT